MLETVFCRSNLYTSVKGDGAGGVVRFVADGTGSITSAEVVARGSGYTYANVLGNGNLFDNQGLSNAIATAGGATGAIEVVHLLKVVMVLITRPNSTVSV